MPALIEQTPRGMTDPRLSVIIPTWNRAVMTLRALRSVLEQPEAGRLEVIVVIDGSTDDTETLLRAHHGRDSRVEILVIPHGGVSAARNAGFAESRGELVCFLDSDDYWLPGVVAIVEAVFVRHPELVFISLDGSTLPTPEAPALPRVMQTNGPGWSHAAFAKAPIFSEKLELGPDGCDGRVLHGDFFPAIIHGDMFQVDGLFMSRGAVLGAGPFNSRFDYLEDWEFFARLCLQGPGAYVDHAGFCRDVGRTDELTHGRADTLVPLRHLFILRSLPRRFPRCTAGYAECLRGAMTDAYYQMGAALSRSGHRRWSRRYLRRCLKRRYKIGRSMVRLAMSLLPRRSGR
ncbi:MAG: glycosyltransferase family 2 protein [Rhodanobacteraceae bacterium]